MTSHVHLIIGTSGQKMEDILRDFKSHTSRTLRKVIAVHPQESRREWLLWMMERAGKKNGNNKDFQLWQQDNQEQFNLIFSFRKISNGRVISGSEQKVLQLGNMQGLTEPIYTKYIAFNLKAIDRIPQNRRNVTELKFIFDFLENHWDQGNKFKITLESTYYACESCQGYLVYLKKLAKKHDKVLDIEVVAEESVLGAESLSDYLRIN